MLPPGHAHAIATEKYLAAHNAEVLFTLDIITGETKTVMNGNDWLNHPQFSPTDPKLIMDAHERPSEKVDRIWTIRTEAGAKPHMFMSRSGQGVVTHEFWSHDGKTIWFDRQLRKGEDFTLTGIQLVSGAQTTFKIGKAESSLHYSIFRDGKPVCGDGNVRTHGEIGVNGHRSLNRARFELFRPMADGTLHSTRLVSTSNMLGAEAVFAVEIAKVHKVGQVINAPEPVALD